MTCIRSYTVAVERLRWPRCDCLPLALNSIILAMLPSYGLHLYLVTKESYSYIYQVSEILNTSIIDHLCLANSDYVAPSASIAIASSEKS